MLKSSLEVTNDDLGDSVIVLVGESSVEKVKGALRTFCWKGRTSTWKEVTHCLCSLMKVHTKTIVKKGIGKLSC